MKLEHRDLIALVLCLTNDDKTVRFRVKGRSMLPLLRDGRDLVEVASGRPVVKGDIVLARINAEQCVLHRVVGRKDDYLLLMGDGNIYATEWCLYSDVLGRVVRIERNGKHISVDRLIYRLFTKLWIGLIPMRRYMWCFFRLFIKWNDR